MEADIGVAESNPGDRSLADALRTARVAEAARFEAVLEIRDAQSLRLQALKDDLAPVVASLSEARELFDLAVVPGDPPRLWIDLVSSVAMEPDPQTYRLTQDSQSGRELLFETADRAEMVEKVKQHMAHRLIARQRQLAAPTPRADHIGYSTGAVILAWISGFSVGILVLVIAAIVLRKAGLLPVTF